MSRRIEHTVISTEAGQRLDRLVADLLGLGRQRTGEIFDGGWVRIGRMKASKGARSVEGQRLTIIAPDPAEAFRQPELPLDLLLTTAQLVAVNKPAGQHSVALRSGDRDTLANALVGHYPEVVRVGHGPLESGLLHRLDTGTSGVLVAARTQEAFERLSESLRAARWQKRYLAIVANLPPDRTGSVEGWLSPSESSSRRVIFSPTQPRSRSAYRTACHWRIEQTRNELCLLDVTLSKAYRHQIRVMLASIGCPLVGDAVYGGMDAGLPRGRHALHASHVAWAGDDLIDSFVVQAPLPDDLRQLMESGAPLGSDSRTHAVGFQK